MLLSLLSQPWLFLPVISALIIAFTVHEFSHAFAADTLGDATPRNAGRLTLNPISHLHPIGFLLLITAGFGFGKPVPFDDRNLKNPKLGAALIGLAGPFSNLIVAFLAAGALVLLVGQGMLQTSLLYVFLLFLVQFNVALLVFNLLPIPPLDGSKVLFAALPAKYDHVKDWLENYGPMVLLTLVLIDTATPISIFGGLFQAALRGIETIVVSLANLA